MLNLLLALPVRLNKRASLGLLLLAAGASAPLFAQDYATPYTFTLLAGNTGFSGSSDGTGSAALFNQPYGLALDSSGNLYVADKANHIIRKITSAGVVTTLAGSAGSPGSINGTGSDALFNQPTGVAVDSGGNVYVADSANNLIRKITSSGVVTTFAGTAGSSGAVDSNPGPVTFNQPYGVAVDGSGNVYVTEFNNNTIRMITSGGTVTTLAGTAGVTGSANATGSSASFHQPIGIAADTSGNLYVADSGNNLIRKVVASTGVVTTLAGSAGVEGTADGTGTAALFHSPRGVAVDGSGNVYVTDSQNCTIRKITPAGVVTTLAGIPGTFANQEGTGAGALFDVPVGIAVDSSGNLYVGSTLGYTISKGSAATSAPPVITLQPTSQVVSEGNSVILSVAATGFPAPTYQWNLGGTAIAGATSSSYSIAAAAPSDTGSYTVTVTNSAGSVTSAAATLTVSLVSGPPLAAAQPVSQTIASGHTVIFSFPTTGTPAPTYQWSLNGVALPSATSPSLIISGATAADAGTYTCAATNASGTVTSTAATLTVVSTANPGRLVNLSARALVGTGGNIIFGGFAVGGPTTNGPLPVLIRASGPAIAAAPFDVPGTLPDPQLQLFDSAGVALTGDENEGWQGSTDVAATAAAVGAFTWSDSTSHDAALDLSLSGGTYTAQVAGQSGDTGVALVEIYDATAAGTYTPASPRLTNLSARVDVGSGAANALFAGFVIAGDSSVTVLIRASGPAISGSPFNVPGTLPDPKLTLEYQSNGDVIASNSGWGGDSQIASTAGSVGAFGWDDPSSHDSAILVTLPPGNYNAVVSGQNGDAGVALVEVYEVP
jgi:sugar lactone lactonase YvrE